jgi:hypothetical protein
VDGRCDPIGSAVEYNTNRPHQSLDIEFPADRFRPRPVDQLGLRPPRALSSRPSPPAASVPPPPVPSPAPAGVALAPTLAVAANGIDAINLAVEICRQVPASGNLGVCGRQFWLGPRLGGVIVRMWIDTTVVHLMRDDVRLKTLPSRFTPANLRQLLADGGQLAGPPRLTVEATAPVEVDRLVNACGAVGLAGGQYPIGYHLAGRRVTVRLDGAVMQILDLDRTLLRTLPNRLPQNSGVGSATPGRPDPPQTCPTRRQRSNAGSAAAAPSWLPDNASRSASATPALPSASSP